MSDPLVPIGDGRTVLSEKDRLGLIPTYISTRGELFDAEQRNIAEALLRRPPTVDQLLDDQYLRNLHETMFGQVWEWAGRYRHLETNVGIEPSYISTEVRKLVDDARPWVEHEAFDPDELGVRFHHRLVFIHPFPNGNGRHGRVAADYLMAGLGHERFTWGIRLDVSTGDLRIAYLHALQQADTGEFAALLAETDRRPSGGWEPGAASSSSGRWSWSWGSSYRPLTRPGQRSPVVAPTGISRRQALSQTTHRFARSHSHPPLPPPLTIHALCVVMQGQRVCQGGRGSSARPTSHRNKVERRVAGRRAATVMGGAFCLSSNRSGFSGQMDWGGLGWIIDPDGNVLATTSDEHPPWPSTSI